MRTTLPLFVTALLPALTAVQWFISHWGPSIPREVLGGTSSPNGRARPDEGVIGCWAREGMV